MGKKSQQIVALHKLPLPSGVTLLQGARGQGMAGCPIDYEAFAQSAKNQSMQPVQALRRGVQGEAPGSSCVSQRRNSIFKANLHTYDC